MSNKFIPFSEKEINNVSVYQLKQLLRDNNLTIPNNKKEIYKKLKRNNIPIPKMDFSDSLCASAYPHLNKYTKEEILFLVEEKLNMNTKGMSKIDGCRALHNANIFPERVNPNDSDNENPLKYFQIPKDVKVNDYIPDEPDLVGDYIPGKPLKPLIRLDSLKQFEPYILGLNDNKNNSNPIKLEKDDEYDILGLNDNKNNSNPIKLEKDDEYDILGLNDNKINSNPINLESQPQPPAQSLYNLFSQPPPLPSLRTPLRSTPRLPPKLEDDLDLLGKKCKRSLVKNKYVLRDKKGRFCKKSKKSKKSKK